MQITNAYELKAYFDAGLQICGEEENNLSWIGTDKQRKQAEKTIQEYEMNDRRYPNSFISQEEQNTDPALQDGFPWK